MLWRLKRVILSYRPDDSNGPPIPGQVMASECPEQSGLSLHAGTQHPSGQWWGGALPALLDLENCLGDGSQALHLTCQDKPSMVIQPVIQVMGKLRLGGSSFKASLGYSEVLSQKRKETNTPATKTNQDRVCTEGYFVPV